MQRDNNNATTARKSFSQEGFRLMHHSTQLGAIQSSGCATQSKLIFGIHHICLLQPAQRNLMHHSAQLVKKKMASTCDASAKC